MDQFTFRGIPLTTAFSKTYDHTFVTQIHTSYVNTLTNNSCSECDHPPNLSSTEMPICLCSRKHYVQDYSHRSMHVYTFSQHSLRSCCREWTASCCWESSRETRDSHSQRLDICMSLLTYTYKVNAYTIDFHIHTYDLRI